MIDPKEHWLEVSSWTSLIGEFDKLRNALVEGPSSWMPGMYESPTGEITRLEADTPLGRLARYARIQVGTTQAGPNHVVVPLSWHSLEAEAAFPVFKGRLELTRGSDATHRLELQGVYEVPAGIVGRAADIAALHAVAQLTVDDFVETIAEVLARNALGRSVDEQVRSGRLTLDQEPPGC